MNRVHWITPSIERGSVRWPACQADVSTDEARAYRLQQGKPVSCELRAKVSYDGTQLCVRHAQARALAELLGGVTSPQPAPHSPLWHLSEDNRAACKICNPDQPGESQ